MKPRARTTVRGAVARRIVAVALAALVAAAPSGAQAPAAEPPAGAEATVPFYLEGVDLTIPSPDAFRGWPADALLERPYWLPWNWLSFQRARVFDRPVLLVLTTTWNRDARRLDAGTLADREVWRAINERFVVVRVDADRRPDVRERYGAGSGPRLALLLPDGRPMLSQANPTGQALPIEAGPLDRDGMLFLVREGATYYERWSDLLRGLGERWAKQSGDAPMEAGPVDLEGSDRVARWLAGNADHGAGGFGLAPKQVVRGLLEYAAIREDRGEPDLVEHARLTLTKLLDGPLHDRRDGGLHRQAAAPEWRSIQFEKTLAGNIDLVRELTMALRREESPALRDALRGACRFVTTTLARRGGGFYTAQVADDSSEDGGRYWTAAGDRGAPPPRAALLLAGENARAGAALLRAAGVLGDAQLATAGRAALDLVRSRIESGRGVDHVLEPAPDRRRFLESQADAAGALLDAHETTGDSAYLKEAKGLVDFVLDNLTAPGEAMLRDHLPEAPEIGMLASPRHPPVLNARMARVLNRLAALGEGEGYRERARGILGAFAGDATRLGAEGIEAALAAEEISREPVRIAIEGPPDSSRTRALREAAAALPRVWVVVRHPAEGAARKPAAIVTAGGLTERIDRPERLAAAVAAVAARAAGRVGR